MINLHGVPYQESNNYSNTTEIEIDDEGMQVVRDGKGRWIGTVPVDNSKKYNGRASVRHEKVEVAETVKVIQSFEEFEKGVLKNYSDISYDDRYLELFKEVHSDKIEKIYNRYKDDYTKMIEFVKSHKQKRFYTIGTDYGSKAFYIETWSNGSYTSRSLQYRDSQLNYDAIKEMDNSTVKNPILSFCHNVYLKNIDEDYDNAKMPKEARKYSHY